MYGVFKLLNISYKNEMDRREFAEQYRENVEPIDIRKYQQRKESRTRQTNRTKQPQTRYTASKGTMSRAKKRKRRPNTKLAALILSAAIGVGTIGVINYHDANQPEPTNMIEVQQAGENAQSLGLNEDTVALFEKYDEYFENFDEDAQYHLTDEQVIEMISEIRGMHFSVVKEKTGNLIGEEPKNIKMHYKVKGGREYATIIANEDSYNEEFYSSENDWPFENKNHIPKELSDVIWQLDDLDDLDSNVRTDKITKVNAMKELEELYQSLEQVATGEFVKDEKGNISIIHYEDKQIEQAETDKERD